jgi:hypothetical protein
VSVMHSFRVDHASLFIAAVIIMFVISEEAG